MKAGNRIDSMIDIVGRLTEITTRLIPDDEGVEIRFLNSGPKEQALYKKYATVKTPMDAGDMLTEAAYNGITKLGTFLRAEVLKPYIYDVLETGNGQLKRPFLISIITDGCVSHPLSNTYGCDFDCAHFLNSPQTAIRRGFR